MLTSEASVLQVDGANGAEPRHVAVDHAAGGRQALPVSTSIKPAALMSHTEDNGRAHTARDTTALHTSDYMAASTEQHRLEHSLQPPSLHQSSIPQGQGAEKLLGKAASGKPDPAHPEAVQQYASTWQGLQQQLHNSHHRPKDKSGAQRDRSPQEQLHDRVRHASREQKCSDSREQMHVRSSHRDGKSSHKDHKLSQQHDHRPSHKDARSSHEQRHKSSHERGVDHKNALSGQSDRHRSAGSRGGLDVDLRKQHWPHASHPDKSCVGQHDRKRSRSPRNHSYHINK